MSPFNPKAVTSTTGGCLRNYTREGLAENREVLDPAEMMYQTFEALYTGEGQAFLPADHDEQMRAAMMFSGSQGPAPHQYPSQQPYHGQPQAPQRDIPAVFGNYTGLQQAAGARPPMMRSGAQQPQQQGSLEETMAAVFEARDQLIERFAAVATDRAAGQVLAASIQKIEGQLRAMGASFEPFDPVKLSSGLRTPPTQSCSLDNAKRVAATTSQCYAAHPINKILAGKTKDGRPGVLVVIAGVHNSQRFAVEGRVVPRKGPDFVGNEVIDYVKDAGKGIMSVKVPGQGRWMDVTGDYEVAWRLVS